MTGSQVVDELLADQSYYIEFNGHLTNHAKHAVVALHGIGAEPEEVRRYYDNYAKLTAYGYGLEPPRPAGRLVIDERNWRQHLGKRTGYAAYCDFFDAEERRLGMAGMLRRYVPQLLDGWVSSFTHATIHLGWALDAGSRWMAIEGLAYLAFSFVPCHAERAATVPTGSEPVPGRQAVTALIEICQAWEADRDQLSHWVTEVVTAGSDGIHPELARSGLQYRIARMLSAGHPLVYGSLDWSTGKDVAACFDELYYAVTLLYLSQPGDFVLLHLITSLHAMEQIAWQLPADEQAAVVRSFWVGMLCIVFAEQLFPKAEKLALLHRDFDGRVDPAGSWPEEEWRLLAVRARLEEEEHNPKLVYVLDRLWRRAGRASYCRFAAAQFTRTPALPPTFEQPPAEDPIPSS